MSLTDQAPITPSRSNSGSGNPAYESLNVRQALSRRFNSCCRLSTTCPFDTFHCA